MINVDVVLIELPRLPNPHIDVQQDFEGFSAELYVDRDLGEVEADAYGAAALSMAPYVHVDGPFETRGLVSVDDETLYVYVHAVGPGVFGQAEQDSARALLSALWESVHEAAARR
jgi:hypothetical protein